jgi:hypothetical protein
MASGPRGIRSQFAYDTSADRLGISSLFRHDLPVDLNEHLGGDYSRSSHRSRLMARCEETRNAARALSAVAVEIRADSKACAERLRLTIEARTTVPNP